jgi:4-carboxymuconolactone decarboxylase
MSENSAAQAHQRALETMARAYGWESVADGPGEFFRYTVDHLFGEIWSRPGLSNRDRRLLILGVVAGSGQLDVVPLQADAALGNAELTAQELREVVIFLTHYVGWPRGAAINGAVEGRIAHHERADDTARGSGQR